MKISETYCWRCNNIKPYQLKWLFGLECIAVEHSKQPDPIKREASRAKQSGFSASFALSHFSVLQLQWQRAAVLIRCALWVPGNPPKASVSSAMRCARYQIAMVSFQSKHLWFSTGALSLILNPYQNIAWKKKVNVEAFQECLNLGLFKKKFQGRLGDSVS